MSTYTYMSLDISQLDVAIKTVLTKGNILGIEVTIPAVAKYCDLGNIDHHGPNDTAESPSSCEQALVVELPPPGSIFLTIYPDADSITAMAVLANRAEGVPIDLELIRLVADYDKYGPSMGYPADMLIAVSRIASSRKLDVAEKVVWIQRALRGDVDTDAIAGYVEDHKRDFEEALAATNVTLHAKGQVAIVESKHRYATRIGYAHAKILVCVNSAFPVNFKDEADGTYTKYTICRFNQYVPFDLPGALVELQYMEPGWGGRADIVGSPIGISSKLSLDQVLKVVDKYR
jgi:hypothetical protein